MSDKNNTSDNTNGQLKAGDFAVTIKDIRAGCGTLLHAKGMVVKLASDYPDAWGYIEYYRTLNSVEHNHTREIEIKYLVKATSEQIKQWESTI